VQENDSTTPGPAAAVPLSRNRAAVGRGAGLFALWAVLMPSTAIGDVAVGAAASALATWASLRLLPPATGRVRFGVLLALLPRFAWQSLRAGIDVARRAFAPRMQLAPGYVHYQPSLPPSDARSLFLAMTSQMPGTVPSGTEASGAVAYHCLDVAQPVAEQLAQEEARLLEALGGALGACAVTAEREGEAT
jgi:multicomponent Na+:H+ antiporter subunit E